MSRTSDSLDVLAVGAHPDDVELTVGGTLLLAKSRGLRTGICHCTQGELGTRGTAEIRAAEARAAAEALDVDAVEQLDLGDGRLCVNEPNKKALARVFRRWRPRVVLAPYYRDLHPDHEAAGQLVRQVAFLAGLVHWNPGDEPWRPEGVLYYMSHTAIEPKLIVDISAHFEQKKVAAACYASQFFNAESTERSTFISGEGFWDWWEGRSRYFGHFVGVPHGEAYFVDGPLPMANPFDAFTGFGKYRNS